MRRIASIAISLIMALTVFMCIDVSKSYAATWNFKLTSSQDNYGNPTGNIITGYWSSGDSSTAYRTTFHWNIADRAVTIHVGSGKYLNTTMLNNEYVLTRPNTIQKITLELTPNFTIPSNSFNNLPNTITSLTIRCTESTSQSGTLIIGAGSFKNKDVPITTIGLDTYAFTQIKYTDCFAFQKIPSSYSTTTIVTTHDYKDSVTK